MKATAQQLAILARAHAIRKEQRADGSESSPKRLPPTQRAKLNPKSYTWALKAYFWDDLLLDDNKHCPDRAALLEDYYATVKAIKGKSKRKAINDICRGCVGDISEDGDPGTWQTRTDRCRVTDCPLHPVRRRQKRIGDAKQREGRPLSSSAKSFKLEINEGTGSDPCDGSPSKDQNAVVTRTAFSGGAGK